MLKYTTGELAKLCNVSVRTVQYYDTKDLLKPTELTDGGRRVYNNTDLTKLRQICMLKALGLSLDSIKGIQKSETPSKVLLILLDEQSRQIDAEIEDKQKQQKIIKTLKEDICNTKTISVNSINDIEHIMNEKKKLKKTYAIMLIAGIVMDIIQIGTLVVWITKGSWLPFVIGMAIVIFIAYLLVRMYYKNTAYICPQCNVKFKPKISDFIFSKHTPKTRKLTCTNCGCRGYCVETYAEGK